MDKITLLEKINAGHADFERLLNGLSPDQVLTAGTVGHWSVKDTLAHIAVHEERMLDWMTIRLAGGRPTEYQPYAMPDAELDALNEYIFQRNRSRGWEEVLDEWQAAHLKTLAFVESADPDSLFNPDRFTLAGGEALWQAVAANTYEHCADHGGQIRKRYARSLV